MKITKEEIKHVTHFAWSMVGIPYKLGGNVPQDGGVDCSAFSLELLRALKLWDTSDATAQMILDKFRHFPMTFIRGANMNDTMIMQEGDFLFFGKSASDVTHISYAITPAFMLEAGGTDKNGMVRLRSISWRKDLVAVARFT